MLHPKQLSTNDYSYTLPDNRIARFPLASRDQSKLLVYQQGVIAEDVYANISRHIPQGSLLVFNNTKVLRARIMFQKGSGGVIEIFLLEPEQKEGYASLHEKKGSIRWKCLIGGASKWKRGQVMEKTWTDGTAAVTLQARIADRRSDCFVIEFIWEPARNSFIDILEQAGSIPIPPYLKRAAEPADTERYQTLYAREQGSVAAPTAGLHFTSSVFQSLADKQIALSFITLHVGAGTFAPIKSETLEAHPMHAEWMQIELDFIRRLIACKARVVAVGTTSLRTLESLYWMGAKCHSNPAVSANELAIGQWDAYEMEATGYLDTQTALQALQHWMEKGRLQQLLIETRLLIAPPYRPKVAGALVTNFHQPGSTLLLLVAAVTGGNWKKIYDYALAHDFRFLSYGDGSLIFFD